MQITTTISQAIALQLTYVGAGQSASLMPQLCIILRRMASLSKTNVKLYVLIAVSGFIAFYYFVDFQSDNTVSVPIQRIIDQRRSGK